MKRVDRGPNFFLVWTAVTGVGMRGQPAKVCIVRGSKRVLFIFRDERMLDYPILVSETLQSTALSMVYKSTTQKDQLGHCIGV